MYTTGSTGPAKPALYTHAQLCNIFRYAHRTWRFDASRVPIDMPVFPAFFSIGLAAGGTIVIPPIDYVRQGPAKVDARALLEVINDCKVQTLFASPVILEKLAAEGTPAPSLQTVIGGGAPLYANVIGPLREMLGKGGEVNADYGSTEALPATEMPGSEALAETYAATARGEGLCVGTPFDGVTLKIIDITEGAVSKLRELPRGEIGEIVVRGPHVSTSYANDPASTAQNKITQADGVWHRLGDAGYLDAEGRLWVCGRVRHLHRGRAQRSRSRRAARRAARARGCTPDDEPDPSPAVPPPPACRSSPQLEDRAPCPRAVGGQPHRRNEAPCIALFHSFSQS
jgi:acyl-CoA synthetase (AMP-forming)/AMP-acid ligase II